MLSCGKQLCIYMIGDFILIYMYLVVQSLLVLIAFYYTSVHPCSTRFLLGCVQNEVLIDVQNDQKPRPFCGPGLKTL